MTRDAVIVTITGIEELHLAKLVDDFIELLATSREVGDPAIDRLTPTPTPTMRTPPPSSPKARGMISSIDGSPMRAGHVGLSETSPVTTSPRQKRCGRGR